jgi:glycerophosphoryl diester phosphodiesterase
MTRSDRTAEDVHPFLADSGPIAFAHRGGSGGAPENTLAAFELAVSLGYRYLETDTHVTRDGVLVAFHDDRLDRITDHTGAIAELDIVEVEAADAGHTFSPDGGRSFPFRGCGVRIPRLAEILKRWPNVRVNIDPKSDACVSRSRLCSTVSAPGSGCAWARSPTAVCDGSARSVAGGRARRWDRMRLRSLAWRQPPA